MAEIALIRPPEEAAALDWLRSQPGGRINLPAAELGRRWGWQRQRTGRRLKPWVRWGRRSGRHVCAWPVLHADDTTVPVSGACPVRLGNNNGGLTQKEKCFR
jgi:hypothetical protein